MRTLIGALLAMTALVPVAAAAQDGRRGGPRAERQVNENGRFERAEQVPEDGEAPPPRPVFTERRDEGGEQRRTPRAEVQAEVQAPRPDRPSFAETRDDRPNVRPERRQDTQEFRAGRPDERGDVRPDGRDDRRNFRRDRREDRPALAAGQVPPDRFRSDRRDDRQDVGRGRRDDGRDFRDDRRRDARRDDRDWNRGDTWPQSSFGRDDWDRSSFNRDGRDGWNRGWRQDRRYDYNGYRGQNRSAYRLPRYYAPYGWGGGYRRFQVGFSLTAALWSRNYWIADPWAYRLPPAYGPYRWVRYYDDALLVDVRTGRIVDAVYDIFW